jgi:non-ribosomal peptide synthetase-like protein
VGKAARPCAPQHGEQGPARSVVYGHANISLCCDEVLADIFAATAVRRPDHPALVGPDRTLTYAQANAAADGLARGLARRGLGPGDVVGLWMPRGIDLLVAQLAIAKAGAAWLPFDFDTPVERIAACLRDCDARALFVAAASRAQAEAAHRPLLVAAELIAGDDDIPVDPRARGLAPDHPAYLIYTSGSTGTPKGIAVSHRNICHYVRAANEVYGVRGDDVVFQGASVAFDLAMEEIWVSFLVGATLWVADAGVIADVERLPDVLERAGVTVLDTVPTLVAMLRRDVASLRTIILGGEACPAALVQRWARGGRRMFNSYGPTETTVVATIAEVKRGEPVTIGRPIANYSCYVVDDRLRPVPPGTTGELLIGGPGVCGGYVGRPDLTAQKFIRNPFAAGGADPVLYRSGDAVSMAEDGTLVFHGRIDAQVKLRGFRIELGEIEAALCELPGIDQAAAMAREHDGLEFLVAFVVPARRSTADARVLRERLRRRLPSYMVPGHFEVLAALPRLPSGKVDRNALRALPVTVEQPSRSCGRLTATEQALHAAWSLAFPGARIGREDDFFSDLGGHSLLAARVVSRLRSESRFRALSLQDLYRHRTIAALAGVVDASAVDAAAAAPPAPALRAIPRLRYTLCSVAQAAALLLVYGLFALTVIAPFATFTLVRGSAGVPLAAAAACLAFATLLPSIVAVAIGAKWVLIGRFREGEYPLWGAYYFRWWLVNRLLGVVPTGYLAGSPLQVLYFRLLGAKIGDHAYLGKLGIGAPDLVEIGSHTSIGNTVVFHNATVGDGLLKIARIRLGDHCYVGSSAVLMGGCRMQDYAELGDLGCLTADAEVGEGESWRGSPARFVAKVDRSALPPAPPAGRTRRWAYTALFAGSLMAFAGFIVLPLVPALAAFAHWSDGNREFANLVHVPALALAYVLLVAIGIVILRWTLLPKVQAGTYDIHSLFYVRKWLVDQLMELSLQVLHPVYASVYLPVWYRMLGVRVGRRAEISTAASITHDLLEIGPESFIADAAVVGDANVRYGRLRLQQTRVGTRSFVGNSAVVPDGYALPDQCLLGVLSTPPVTEAMLPGTTWFGTPSIFLPRRQTPGHHDPSLTYQPPLGRILARGAIELIRIIMPTVMILSLAVGLITALGAAYTAFGFIAAALLLPLLYAVVFACPVVLFTVLLKWLVVGRYRPLQRPMWTPFVWRSEAVTSLYESLAVPTVLAMLRGTPFLAVCLRMLGARIGRRVFLETTDMTEFDLVRIGDDAVLNEECAIQTHLFEDRIMKTGEVELGRDVVLGAHAIALYGSVLEEGSRLGPLSLAMKGERLPAGTSWFGSPARLRDESPGGECRKVAWPAQARTRSRT